jgi:IS5 family transposase
VKRDGLDVQTKLARFTRTFVSLAQKAVVGVPAPAVQKGEGGYADWVIVSIHGLKVYLDHPYRRLLDVLHEMPRICRMLDLEPHQLPDFTTVCARMQPLKMSIWRDVLRLSASLQDTGEIQAIDATGMDRVATSRHYANRTNYTFQLIKTTALVDCETGLILDIDCSMKQPHDTQVARRLLARNLDKLSILVADKGYDWELLRYKLRAEGVKPLIKRIEYNWKRIAENALIDDTTYHQRSNIESTFFALRRKYGETVQAKTWYGQWRELVLTCAVRNVELSLSPSIH